MSDECDIYWRAMVILRFVIARDHELGEVRGWRTLAPSWQVLLRSSPPHIRTHPHSYKPFVISQERFAYKGGLFELILKNSSRSYFSEFWIQEEVCGKIFRMIYSMSFINLVSLQNDLKIKRILFILSFKISRLIMFWRNFLYHQRTISINSMIHLKMVP